MTFLTLSVHVREGYRTHIVCLSLCVSLCDGEGTVSSAVTVVTYRPLYGA